jgi:hypothetical protein
MSSVAGLMTFHNFTSANVDGHFELFLLCHPFNHAWIRTSQATNGEDGSQQMELDFHFWGCF